MKIAFHSYPRALRNENLLKEQRTKKKGGGGRDSEVADMEGKK
jgi:hypothetical protein